MLAFLTWVNSIDTNNWPPKPMMAAAATGTKPGETVYKAHCSRASARMHRRHRARPGAPLVRRCRACYRESCRAVPAARA